MFFYGITERYCLYSTNRSVWNRDIERENSAYHKLTFWFWCILGKFHGRQRWLHSDCIVVFFLSPGATEETVSTWPLTWPVNFDFRWPCLRPCHELRFSCVLAHKSNGKSLQVVRKSEGVVPDRRRWWGRRTVARCFLMELRYGRDLYSRDNVMVIAGTEVQIPGIVISLLSSGVRNFLMETAEVSSTAT